MRRADEGHKLRHPALKGAGAVQDQSPPHYPACTPSMLVGGGEEGHTHTDATAQARNSAGTTLGPSFPHWPHTVLHAHLPDHERPSMRSMRTLYGTV